MVFKPDLTQVSAGIQVYAKGIYQLKVQDAKPFKKQTDKGERFGIRYPLLIEEVREDGDAHAKGKKTMFTCYMHNDGGMSMTKQFAMAVLGYQKKEEQKFDEALAGADADIDFEAGTCGEFWKDLSSKSVLSELDSKLGEDGETEFQQFTWIPLQ